MPDPFSWIARYYDRFAGQPDTTDLQRLLALPSNGRLLDLGGGTGRMSQELDAGQVVICDPAAGMVQQARSKGLLACQGPAERLPFATDTFDGVLVVDAFHHFTEQPLAVREMLRVLRPAGRLVIIEPDIRRPLMPLLSWAERRLGMASRMLTPQELGALVIAVGGEVLAVEEELLSYRLVSSKNTRREGSP
jgi:demethylmenaquinone methyltransferase/2-methoxy-6-polyprenyl-1,4-benzoquinol methylase